MKLLLFCASLLFSYQSFADLVSKQTALLTDAQFFKGCEKFKGESTNLDIHFACTSGQLSLEGQILGKKEYLNHSRSLKKDVHNNKSAISAQINDLNGLKAITEHRALLQGATSYAFQIAGILNLNKTTKILDDYSKIHKEIKSLNKRNKTLKSTFMPPSLINKAYAEKFDLTKATPEQLDIEIYIDSCREGTEDLRRKEKLPSMEKACGDLDEREQQIILGGKTVDNPYKLETGALEKGCLDDLKEETAKFLINGECTKTPDPKTCIQQKESNNAIFANFKSQAHKQKIIPLDEKEKKCFRAVEKSFASSRVGASLLTAAIRRYIAYDETLAEVFNDPDHQTTSGWLVRKTVQKRYSHNYKPSKLNQSVAKEEALEYAKTLNNLSFIEKEITKLLNGQDINALTANKFPYEDNHGLSEALNSDRADNRTVLFCEYNTKGIPTDLFSMEAPGLTVGKYLQNDLNHIQEYVEPVTRRLKNSLIYMIAYSKGQSGSLSDEVDPIIEEILGPDVYNNFKYRRSTLLHIIINDAYAKPSSPTLKMFKLANQVLYPVKDAFLSTPLKRAVQSFAVSDRANSVSDALYSKINEIDQNIIKLEKYHDSVLIKLREVLLPGAYAKQASANYKIGCLTRNCAPFTGIINKVNDETPISSDLKKHINLFASFTDEINKNKIITPKAFSLLKKMKKSKTKLNTIQNKATNDLYSTMDSLGVKKGNLKRDISLFEQASREVAGKHLASKGINVQDIETNLFGRVSKAYKKTFFNSNSKGLSKIEGSSSFTNKQGTIPQPSLGASTYDTPHKVEARRHQDSDINMDSSSDLFQSISKKYHFIYYIKK